MYMYIENITCLIFISIFPKEQSFIDLINDKPFSWKLLFVHNDMYSKTLIFFHSITRYCTCILLLHTGYMRVPYQGLVNFLSWLKKKSSISATTLQKIWFVENNDIWCYLDFWKWTIRDMKIYMLNLYIPV